MSTYCNSSALAIEYAEALEAFLDAQREMGDSSDDDAINMYYIDDLLGCNDGIAILAAYGYCLSLKIAEVEDWISDAFDAYRGAFYSDRTFAMDYAGQIADPAEEMHWPFTCIDWDMAALDLMYDFFEENGFYFLNQ